MVGPHRMPSIVGLAWHVPITDHEPPALRRAGLAPPSRPDEVVGSDLELGGYTGGGGADRTGGLLSSGDLG